MRLREHFDAELAALRERLASLGALTSTALGRALTALETADLALAAEVVADDAVVNAAQLELEQHAIHLIASQQPVARDLRRIIATIAISYELERIADYAKSTARLVVGGIDPARPPLAAPADLIALGAAARATLDRTLAAISAGDAGAAASIAAAEDEVDSEYKRLKAALIAKLTPAATADLLFIAHNFERVSDRATNMAEQLVYTTSGGQVELNP